MRSARRTLAAPPMPESTRRPSIWLWRRSWCRWTRRWTSVSPLSPSFQTDLLMGKREDGSVANLWPYWSSLTDSGVLGDATAATREKGEQFLEAAVEGLIELIREFRTVAINPRKDHISPETDGPNQ